MRTLAIICVLFLACIAHATTCDYNKKGQTQSCTLGGRTMRLHIPPATFTGALPVVIYLHGAPGGIWEGESMGWTTTADKYGFIEVSAAGSILSTGTESWHIYNDTNNYSGTAPDDVAELKQVVADIAAKTSINAKAVFATGFSAGGFMAERIAAEGGDVFAAVAPYDATLDMEGVGYGNGLPTTVKTPISIHEMNGATDTTIPICGLNNGAVVVDSVDTTLAWWKLVLGCKTETPATSVCVSGNPVLTSKTLSSCNAGATVEWVSMAGIGHSWKAGNPNDAIWNFLIAHKKP